LAERLYLIGMMGSGKTTVGRQVAARLGWSYLDSDEQVCARTGRTVREIFETDGEAAFRAEESAVLAAAAADPDTPTVVAVAGGAVLDPANRALLRGTGAVVWLDASPEVLVGRVNAGGDHRPLLGDDAPAALARLDHQRRPLYEQLADLVVDVSRREPAAIVDQVVTWHRDRSPA
jgi:shikimate kinase